MDLFLATLIQCCHLRVICVVSVAHSISLNTFCYVDTCCLCFVYFVTPSFGLSEIRLLQLVQIQVSPRRTGVEGCTPSGLRLQDGVRQGSAMLLGVLCPHHQLDLVSFQLGVDSSAWWV